MWGRISHNYIKSDLYSTGLPIQKTIVIVVSLKCTEVQDFLSRIINSTSNEE